MTEPLAGLLTPERKSRLEALLGGAIVSSSTASGGYTPAARWLIETRSGRFFAKMATTPLTAALLRREARSYQAIRGSFMPELIGWQDHETEPLLIVEDLAHAHWPPPWRKGDVEKVLEQINALHQTEAAVPTYAEIHGHWANNWTAVADDPEPFLSLGLATRHWLKDALPLLLAAEDNCSPEGNALTHLDIRSDNSCITATGAKLIDWPEACLSNPKLDLGFWLPSLAYEGGPEPESILPDAPEVAAWVAGFFAARAGLPAIPDAPRVRLVQRQQLETALPWAIRALDLPRLEQPEA